MKCLHNLHHTLLGTGCLRSHSRGIWGINGNRVEARTATVSSRITTTQNSLISLFLHIAVTPPKTLFFNKPQSFLISTFSFIITEQKGIMLLNQHTLSATTVSPEALLFKPFGPLSSKVNCGSLSFSTASCHARPKITMVRKSRGITIHASSSFSMPSYEGARIKVIGVGGGGNNAVNRMIASDVQVVFPFYLIAELKHALFSYRIQI